MFNSMSHPGKVNLSHSVILHYPYQESLKLVKQKILSADDKFSHISRKISTSANCHYVAKPDICILYDPGVSLWGTCQVEMCAYIYQKTCGKCSW